MVSLRRRWLVIVVLLTLVPCTAARCQQPGKQKPKSAAKTPVIPENVVLESNVQYGNAGGRALVLDVVRPREAGEKPRPAIVFVHGGGWSGGNKESAVGSLIPFASTGNYFCATVEYRLSGEAIWPAQIQDCKAAVRWLKANAKKYNIDPKRIGVWGGSAGGHLVSMLGLTGGVRELEGDGGWPDQSSRVACVVDFCGPSDFPSIAKVKADAGRNAYGPVSKLLGGPVEENEELAKAASPLSYVSKDAPPFLIVHGTADNTVPLAQAESLYEALKISGADATFVKIEGGGHGIRGIEVLNRVRNFFDKHLLGRNVVVSDKAIPFSPAPQSKK
ncbi:MAG TPA: alpha/beta hydrolase [Thermoguttaceae bacterium]|nr:alpha/beta hydrolase [Thermoguttaceae bacterium]